MADGKFGKLYSRDRDNHGPWHVMLDGESTPNGGYHLGDPPSTRYLQYAQLEWAK